MSVPGGRMQLPCDLKTMTLHVFFHINYPKFLASLIRSTASKFEARSKHFAKDGHYHVSSVNKGVGRNFSGEND